MLFRMPLSSMINGFAFLGILLLLGTGTAHAQVLVANDDNFSIPFGEPLVVECYGVLDNDILDGESAGENGTLAELVSDVSFGTLALNPDGSFSYSPGPCLLNHLLDA